MGRNGNSRDDPATLSIFPNVAPVVIKMYFKELANVSRPSTTPSASTERSFSSNTKSAAYLATSTALLVDIPVSAAMTKITLVQEHYTVSRQVS